MVIKRSPHLLKFGQIHIKIWTNSLKLKYGAHLKANSLAKKFIKLIKVWIDSFKLKHGSHLKADSLNQKLILLKMVVSKD